MILTQLPDLPPRPETDANTAFRRRFYARWGHENAIVSGEAVRAEYAAFTQTLSLKTAWGGRERFFLRGREVAVDDDHWLALDEGSTYGSLLEGRPGTSSFCIFFRPGLQHEVAAARREPLARALDAGAAAPALSVAVSPHLRPHGDGAVSTRLRAMRVAVQAGERDTTWLDEQCLALADALLAEDGAVAAVPAGARPVQRQELRRRLHLAADFLDTCHAEPITLDRMAAVACLSRYHFVRCFHAQFGLSPQAWLQRKRARVAARLIAAGEHDREAVALRAGFGSRWALQRALKKWGTAPR